MNILKLILYPLAALYNLIMRFRNYLYDIGQKPSIQFERVVITVGNLNVGGSGKTPMVEYLIQLLHQRYAIATLSRGYKRITTGYRLAQSSDTASTLGDEPYQLYAKFGDRIKVAVGEDRVLAIPQILHDFPETRIFVLDDALQHRAIKPQLTILLTEQRKPFYRDFLMPFGRLREARSGAKRSDLVVVTKCSETLDLNGQNEIMKRIVRYTGPKPVFFAQIQYGAPVPFGVDQIFCLNVIVVSGIAGPDHLHQYCQSNFNVLKVFNYPDHHRYTEGDLVRIQQFVKEQKDPISIITTEKDRVKLIDPELKSFVGGLPWFCLPITHAFLQDGPKFDSIVLEAAARPF